MGPLFLITIGLWLGAIAVWLFLKLNDFNTSTGDDLKVHYTFEKKRKVGVTIVEVVAAMAMMGVALVAFTQVQHALRMTERIAVREAIAMQQLENEAAKIRAASWDDLKEGSALRELMPKCREALPDAKLEIHIEDLEQASLSAKRIRITLGWRKDSLRDSMPMSLELWRFQSR